MKVYRCLGCPETTTFGTANVHDRVTPPWLTDQYKGEGQVKCKTVTMRKNKRAAHCEVIVL